MTHTTLLTGKDIEAYGIVQNPQEKGWRATSYDSTVGTIIGPDGVVDGKSFKLHPRSIAWVISNEQFTIPANVTGITTLKTGWTKKGLLTLTVGIVDPNYSGPLSTAVVNFSKTDFEIDKGMPFFRTAFFQHEKVEWPVSGNAVDAYERDVREQSNKFSENFLNIDSLAHEIAPKIFAAPRSVFYLGVVAILVSVAVPIVSNWWSLGSEIAFKNHEIGVLERRIERLESSLQKISQEVSDQRSPPTPEVLPQDSTAAEAETGQ
jgi:deoxycytidine triphosphate deaminase